MTCTLALLQEEVADGVFGTLPLPPEVTPWTAAPLALPSPPVCSVTATTAMDHRGTEAARAGTPKVKALRHVQEELLDIFGLNTASDRDDDTTGTGPAKTVVAISRQALSGGIQPRFFSFKHGYWVRSADAGGLVQFHILCQSEVSRENDRSLSSFTRVQGQGC